MRRSAAFLVLACGAFLAAGCDGGQAAPAPEPELAGPPAHPSGSKFEIPSGLPDVVPVQVEVLRAGTGRQAKKGSSVAMNFSGAPQGGKEYDSSQARGGPKEFVAGLGSVIPGWDLAATQMRAGDHWIVTIPPQLAYGPHGGPKVPPNSTVVLDLEMVRVD